MLYSLMCDAKASEGARLQKETMEDARLQELMVGSVWMCCVDRTFSIKERKELGDRFLFVIHCDQMIC